MDFVDAINLRFKQSTRYFYWSMSLSFLVLVLTLLSLCGHEALTTVCIVMLLPVQIGQIALKLLSQSTFESGQKFRRWHLVKAGLGREIPVDVLNDMRMNLGRKGHTFKGDIRDGWFSAKQTHPPRKLLEHMAESAFYTKYMAHRCFYWSLAFSVLMFIAGVVVLALAALFVKSTPTLNPILQGALIVMAFWTTGELGGITYGYYSLWHHTETYQEIMSRAALASDTDDIEAMRLFGEYNCGLMNTPPIPVFVYARYKKRLEKSWHSLGGDT